MARMSYALSKYTLNNLSVEILKCHKSDVDSVAIRQTFQRLKETNTLYPSDDAYMTKHRIPALRDILHYNNRDTLLVSELLDKTKAIDYILYTYAYDIHRRLMTTSIYDDGEYELQ